MDVPAEPGRTEGERAVIGHLTSVEEDENGVTATFKFADGWNAERVNRGIAAFFGDFGDDREPDGAESGGKRDLVRTLGAHVRRRRTLLPVALSKCWMCDLSDHRWTEEWLRKVIREEIVWAVRRVDIKTVIRQLGDMWDFNEVPINRPESE
jgi:hypothetical protein